MFITATILHVNKLLDSHYYFKCKLHEKGPNFAFYILPDLQSGLKLKSFFDPHTAKLYILLDVRL